MSVTPCARSFSPARVSSQLPPRSAARSTITEPGAMPATISLVTSTRAVLPGTTSLVPGPTPPGLAAPEKPRPEHPPAGGLRPHEAERAPNAAARKRERDRAAVPDRKQG